MDAALERGLEVDGADVGAAQADGVLAERDAGELEAAGGVAGGGAGAVVDEDADAGERDAIAAAEDEAGQRGRLDGGQGRARPAAAMTAVAAA